MIVASRFYWSSPKTVNITLEVRLDDMSNEDRTARSASSGKRHATPRGGNPTTENESRISQVILLLYMFKSL